MPCVYSEDDKLNRKQKRNLLYAIEEYQEELGFSVKDACKHARLPMQTYYDWRSELGLSSSDPLTREEAKEYLDKVEVLRAKGRRSKDACEEAGCTYNQYVYWARKFREEAEGKTKKTSLATSAEVPQYDFKTPSGDRMVVISADQLEELSKKAKSFEKILEVSQQVSA
jgi:transposase-like protein